MINKLITTGLQVLCDTYLCTIETTNETANSNGTALTEHGAPGLVDHVQANRAGHLVDVRVEHAVFEAYRGRLEGVLLWQRNMHLPDTSLVRSFRVGRRHRSGA